MLRITDMNGAGGGRTLKIEGRIDAAQIEELSRAVAAVLTAAPLVLDMSGVTYVDRPGVDLLHVLRGRGVQLRNCSPFIETLISTESR